MSGKIECKHRRSVEDYMKDRLEEKINRYTRKAYRYRTMYFVLAGTAAIGSLLVPVLVNTEGNIPVWVTTVLSLLVAIAVALEGLFHSREHWRNYDLISSKLREEEMRFSTKAEPYANGESAFTTFVDQVEDAIAKERAETIAMRTAPSKSVPSEDLKAAAADESPPESGPTAGPAAS